MNIEWNSDWSVGNDLLDAQHKRLLELVQNAIDCAYSEATENHAEFHNILADVSSYAKSHFATEEGLLRQVGYEGLDEQVAEHMHFNAQMSDFMSAALLGRDEMIRFAEFLTYWWSDHILQNDMQYKPLMAK